MADSPQSWLCSYDIRQVKRLTKIHNLLSMQGIALNYSVFYLELTTAQAEQLKQKLQKLLHANDDVRLYRCQALSSAHKIGEFTPLGIQLL